MYGSMCGLNVLGSILGNVSPLSVWQSTRIGGDKVSAAFYQATPQCAVPAD